MIATLNLMESLPTFLHCTLKSHLFVLGRTKTVLYRKNYGLTYDFTCIFRNLPEKYLKHYNTTTHDFTVAVPY